ncbi:hypothetical protein GCM10010403_27910 [Glycomyces rutgersensis]|uniref:Uncharacterized protein n=1 Tax=Glycomyces rutgersensis TaxID=58115 RepID=A0ABP5SLV7_9ACTN
MHAYPGPAGVVSDSGRARPRANTGEAAQPARRPASTVRRDRPLQLRFRLVPLALQPGALSQRHGGLPVCPGFGAASARIALRERSRAHVSHRPDRPLQLRFRLVPLALQPGALSQRHGGLPACPEIGAVRVPDAGRTPHLVGTHRAYRGTVEPSAVPIGGAPIERAPGRPGAHR